MEKTIITGHAHILGLLLSSIQIKMNSDEVFLLQKHDFNPINGGMEHEKTMDSIKKVKWIDGSERFVKHDSENYEIHMDLDFIKGKYMHRITQDPMDLSVMTDDEVMIFGSNLNGNHLGGLAKACHVQCGATWGQGVGLSGKSYAFPTLDKDMLKMTTEGLEEHVVLLEKCINDNPTKRFYLSPVGCGIAGFTPDEIAPIFERLRNHPRIYFPESFLKIYSMFDKGIVFISHE